MNWQSIAEFITPELPVSPLPGRLPGKLSIRLQTTLEAQEGSALLTTLDKWKHYAGTAPAVRLEQLKFAAAENGDVLIWGTPLPSLPGREFYQVNSVLLPSGYGFEVPLAADLYEQKYNAEKDALLLFMPSGHWHRIPLSSFVTASRSAIRFTPLTSSE